jgi:hypothetical protein
MSALLSHSGGAPEGAGRSRVASAWAGVLHPVGTMLSVCFPQMIRTMLFLTAMRRAVARAVLARIARAIAVDLVPTKRRRSRWQHLRNGLGAILQASSRVALRRNSLVSLFYYTRPEVQSEFHYGLGELRSALSPPSDARKRRALLLAVVPSIAALLAVAARTRGVSAGSVQPLVSSQPPQAPASVGG